MDFRTKTLQELALKKGALSGKTGLAGFDGFVDRIRKPVRLRFGTGKDFEPIPTIAEFSERIAGAAGKSTNIELYPLGDRPGGNGPILAGALLALGLKTRYIGALGNPEIHPVFQDLAQKTGALSIARPSISTNLEFTDGKLMFGETASLEEISFERIITQVGEGKFLDLLSRMDLIALVNWTMTPQMTPILQSLLDRILPVLPPRDQRLFFFDLCDPEKRSETDLRNALETIARFQNWGSVTLGLNLKEGLAVARTLGIDGDAPDENGLRRITSAIRRKLGIECVAIHPVDSAACATKEESFWVPGPYTKNPLITTGAGDHFNAGFAAAQLIGASPLTALTAGVCSSGLFVRTGKSPSLNDIDRFLHEWKSSHPDGAFA